MRKRSGLSILAEATTSAVNLADHHGYALTFCNCEIVIRSAFFSSAFNDVLRPFFRKHARLWHSVPAGDGVFIVGFTKNPKKVKPTFADCTAVRAETFYLVKHGKISPGFQPLGQN